jgi:hypothetical protein
MPEPTGASERLEVGVAVRLVNGNGAEQRAEDTARTEEIGLLTRTAGDPWD